MKYLIFVILLLPIHLKSQNLIPNGSFEDTTACPYLCNQLEKAVGWYNPTLATPDLFHSCNYNCNYGTANGFQMPRTGIAYGGYVTGNPFSNGREYVETIISTPLIAGECYHVEFYISASHQKFVTDDTQIYFSDSLIIGFPTYEMLPFIPQVFNAQGNYPDTTNWTLVQGDYFATGGENYMIIGNFFDTTNTIYIQHLPSTFPGGSFHYIDDVSLTHSPCTGLNEINTLTVNVFPNPVSKIINFKLNSDESFDLNIFDSASKLFHHSSVMESASVDVCNFTSGIYTYRLVNSKNSFVGKLLVY